MRDFDKEIDETLAALTDARPPAGMQMRILRTVEERSTQQRGWSGWMLPVGAFGMVVIAALVGAELRHRGGVGMADRASVAAVPHTPEKASSEIAAAVTKQRPERMQSMTVAQVSQGVRQIGEQPRSERRIVAGPEPATEQERLLVQMVAAYEDPAPTATGMPIAKRQVISVSRKPTEEERLLVKIAMTGDASQRAALDPEERQKQQDEMQKQFQAFLDEPTT